MMAFDGTDPAWCLALPLGNKRAWRLRIAQFGDGYQQRILDGINALDRSWDVRAEMKPAAVINAMSDYLEAAKAAAFPFLDPGTGEIISVFCDEWDVEWNVTKVVNGIRLSLYGTLSAEFRRANGVQIGPIT